MERDFSAYCFNGTVYSAEQTELDTGVSLLTVIFTPPEKRNLPVIVFVPGLASVIDNFTATLKGLNRYYEVHYIETREKKTALIDRMHGFTVLELVSDLVSYLNNKFSDNEDYVLVGYSLGATVISESFSLLKRKPVKIILIEPNSTFNFPWWSLILARGAKYLYGFVKPFLKWYIRKFRVNTAEDNEMYLINCRILDAADPVRLGLAIRALKQYRIGECLGGLSVPVMVVGASKDKFHSHDEALKISGGITSSIYIDLEDNTRTHSVEMAEIINRFITSPLQ
jgi:pimeloyl-ACP methyl ester carboxylesterase